jgi:hypothetical protein
MASPIRAFPLSASTWLLLSRKREPRLVTTAPSVPAEMSTCPMLLPGCNGVRVALISGTSVPSTTTSVGIAVVPLSASGTVGGMATSAFSLFRGSFLRT